ncbi:hypothetical protein HDU97_002338 [Phlyctochytrium planicorne]|nr:hypothetical protein HDU97_002338 [Phlyctochytrium planicorne]
MEFVVDFDGGGGGAQRVEIAAAGEHDGVERGERVEHVERVDDGGEQELAQQGVQQQQNQEQEDQVGGAGGAGGAAHDGEVVDGEHEQVPTQVAAEGREADQQVLRERVREVEGHGGHDGADGVVVQGEEVPGDAEAAVVECNAPERPAQSEGLAMVAVGGDDQVEEEEEQLQQIAGLAARCGEEEEPSEKVLEKCRAVDRLGHDAGADEAGVLAVVVGDVTWKERALVMAAVACGDEGDDVVEDEEKERAQCAERG